MERPEQFPGPGVVATDRRRCVLRRRRSAAAHERRPHDDDVSDHRRWRAGADRGGLEIHFPAQIAPEVHHPVEPESRNQPSGVRVERHQPVRRGDQKHPRRLAVAPEGDAPSGGLPGRRLPAFPLVEAVGPQRLAGGGVHRDGRAPGASGDVDDPVQHQRGGPQVEIGARPEVPRGPAPDDLQLVHVAGVDLVQRGVAGRGQVRGVVRPFRGVAVLRERRGGERQRRPEPDQPPEYQIR